MQRRPKWIVGGVATMAALGAAGAGIAAGGGGNGAPLTDDRWEQAVAAALDYTGGGTVTETEVDDDGAAYEVEIRKPDGSQVEVQLDRNFAVTGSQVDDDPDGDDAPLTGGAWERAVAAALEHAGGGTVTETEMDDDGAVYEVEVRRPDGSEVEVQLDRSFTVTGSEVDDEPDAD